MRTFLLVRHAKAERADGVADIDRALADRGRSDAELVGRFLIEALPRPGAIVSSPARRARETAAIVSASANWRATVAIDDRLYGGGVSDLMAVLTDSDADPIVAFGHEPVWSTTVSTLIGGGDITMVTCAVACLEGQVQSGGATLRWMIAPAALGGGPS